MTAILRQVSLAEVSTVLTPRFNTEAAREGLPFTMAAPALEAAHKDGAILLVENADVRTVVYCHHEASDPSTEVYVNFILALSTHVLDVFLAVTNFLIAQGFTTAKFQSPPGAPSTNYAVQAATLTGATRNAKGEWSVPLATAKTKLIAAGAK